MSDEMPSSSWRYLSSAGSRLSSFKGYLSGRDPGGLPRTPRGTSGTPGEERQSWRAWAGQKIRGRGRNGDDPANRDEEFIHLFPGWAARRYQHKAENNTEGPPAFGIDVFVSGFASTRRGAENSSRSQRAFVRLAKGFASLPKLVETLDPTSKAGSSTPNLPKLTPSTEELLAQTTLPPRPEDISQELDIEAIEEQFRRAKEASLVDEDSESNSSLSSRSSLYDVANNDTHRPASTLSNPSTSDVAFTPIDFAKRWHENLEKRIQLLWYSVLPNRTVRLHLFVSHRHEVERNSQGNSGPPPSNLASSPTSSFLSATPDLQDIDSEYGPLASADVPTAADGSFQFKFRVDWEALCHHPRALQIAYDDSIQEHDLLVVAQLLPQPDSSSQAALGVGTPGGSTSDTPRAVSSGSYFNHHYRTTKGRNGAHLGPPQSSPGPPTESLLTPPPLLTLTRIPITYSPIRVVSDIDDTVKYSGILGGARAAFHNVFVKDLKDGVIPGMGDWYMRMYSQGVRFHYVSNGPFSVLPILNEFFEISQLPPGSIKLRSYAGRSIFNGLLSAPAVRKRAGVVDILDSFPDSRFLLIGDTGEQDLELYMELARERPHQIIGVFLRDADTVQPGSSSVDPPRPLLDPTGRRALEGPFGTRPGIPRNDSSSSSWSQLWGRSNSKGMTVQQNSLPDYALDDTPKPNRYTVDVGASRSNLNDKVARENIHYIPGPLSAEPISEIFNEESTLDPESVMTPTAKTAHLPNTSLMTPRGGKKSASQPLPLRLPRQYPDTIVTQAPKPTPAPSIQPQSTIQSDRISTYSRRRTDSISSTSTASDAGEKKSDIEKRRQELQLRIHRARVQIPGHIPLRVFRDPVECAEIEEVIQREMGALNMGNAS